MLVKNTKVKKQKLHDGNEHGLYEKAIKIKGISCECGNCYEISISELKELGDLNKEQLEILVAFKDVYCEDVLGIEIYKTKKSLPAYYAFLDCNKCLKRYLAVVGFDEVQPSRYLVELEAIYLEKPS